MLIYKNIKARREGCGWLLTATLHPSGHCWLTHELLEVHFKRAADMGEFCKQHNIPLTFKDIQL